MCIYIDLSFNLNAQLKKLISFTFVLFYETTEYVDNALCTVLVAPYVLDKYDHCPRVNLPRHWSLFGKI